METQSFWHIQMQCQAKDKWNPYEIDFTEFSSQFEWTLETANEVPIKVSVPASLWVYVCMLRYLNK